MKVLKYKYNPEKKGVFRVSIVKNPAVGEGDLVLMAADIENGDAPITTYADMLVKNPEGKVLILKRNPTCEFEPNKWGFPGGKVMPGETTMSGAVRECLEECGVNVENVKAQGEIVNDDKTSSHYFTGTATNDPKLGDEHQDLAWVSSDELKDYDFILNNEDRFRKLIDGEVVEMSAQEIKGVFYSPVMIPDVKITRIDPKTQEKYLVYYDAETVEQLANNYFKQCGNRDTNLEHEADNVEGVYPVESWIVKDPENDKSKAIGMPLQKAGTWIMGYKVDDPKMLEQVKNDIIKGVSIEGHLDMEEDTDSPIAKFNKHTMSLKKLMDGFEAFKTVLMAAEEEAKNPEEKTAEELAAEEAKKAQEMADAVPPADAPPAEPTDAEKELEALKAENEMLKKDKADLEAELATYKNDAVLMSAQLEEVKTAFESYKTVKMSSQSLGNLENKKVEKPYAEMTNAEKTKYNRNN